ncbi:1-acyl-sn-glycerol-3-phosphate acyltransferase [Marinomonas sp. 15G1-11]|uniref:1-acyl-sn-glycerol-3-phosphate acyltransferase n=1 Tax=Marinomonas phaeophyticola TaxID=3004091 RepID=A0ABT4JVV8_9GAMM|nr:1-acyl-sn-glycerol-3-phosphate acyltransferase [Marinomonas sp. 15G1-11]MCZ2722479.1 1-acyl-sn-glycerol-3-phosphate acyltransferase [Marinomonas sp. 15G1-11]
MDQFHDIRPYNDNEVVEVLERLINTPDFINTIISFRFPSWPQFMHKPLVMAVKWQLRRQLSNISDVYDFQRRIAGYMERMIKTTTTSVEYRGVDKLEKGKGYLFISNHRDIAMDPAFINYGLYLSDFDTVRVAIGDNLLRRPFVSDLMRLNKSFIVKRSVAGVREMMAAFGQLSNYINHSITEERCNIWIAQKEGRAKDGLDKTDPAIVKMFYMSKKKMASFPDAMKDLNIVPVSISYEYDPCALDKAAELVEKSTTGEYEKAEFEDIDSIKNGIVGQKGKVIVTFGDVLTNGYDTPDELVTEIDRQIIGNYAIHSTNKSAMSMLEGAGEVDPEFDAYMALCPEPLRETVLKMYANPLIQQLSQSINKE